MIACALKASDIERLGKFLGKLGSAHEGERANAALMADKPVCDRGAAWPELLEPLRASCDTQASCLAHRRDAFACLELPELWGIKEIDFRVNMSRRRTHPTPAQAIWLADLLDRARAHGASS